MSVTIKKIASDLKLAVSTVSKALRDSHEISIATKRRVFEHAAKLDYLPNPYASSLKKRQTGNIAVVLPEVADSFFSTAINGIESVAQRMGYHVMIYITHEDPKKELAILRDFRSGRVDGVLISVSGSEGNHQIYKKCAKEIPVVFFDRICENIESAKVLTDDFESCYKATKHLIMKGCKQIAFLAMTGNIAIINNRLKGYKKALEDNHLNSNDIIYCTHDEGNNRTLLKKLLTRKNRPDGIIGSVEKVAIQAYSLCNELNLNIPNQIKIIAFSSLQIASLLNPSLTTITQPAFEMGKAAAAILFKALEKKHIDLTKEKILLPSTLIERGSTSNGA